jgi:hypothetical protein
MDTLQKNIADTPLYIAFVLDESGSIDGAEEQHIREELMAFIEAHTNQNIILSLIGMSYSNKDTPTVEADFINDYILEQPIGTNKEAFLAWIRNYKKKGGNIHPDYWMSGLSVINTLKTNPDIIIVIANGLRSKSPQNLETLYQQLNRESHKLNRESQIFVYAVGTTTYEITLKKLPPPDSNAYSLSEPPTS